MKASTAATRSNPQQACRAAEMEIAHTLNISAVR
jgi:hypothetical protein